MKKLIAFGLIISSLNNKVMDAAAPADATADRVATYKSSSLLSPLTNAGLKQAQIDTVLDYLDSNYKLAKNFKFERSSVIDVLKDGRLVQKSGEYLEIFDVTTGTIYTLGKHQNVLSLKVLDGNRLATLSSDCIKIWDLKTNQCVFVRFNDYDFSYNASMLPLKKDKLAIAIANKVTLLDLNDGKITQILNCQDIIKSLKTNENNDLIVVLNNQVLVFENDKL